MIELFFIGLSLQVLGAASVIIIKPHKAASTAAHLLNAFGIVLSLIFTIQSLVSGVQLEFLPQWVDVSWFRFDPLGLYFLGVIQIASLPCMVYNHSYLSKYIGEGRFPRPFVIFFSLLIISTQVLVVANHVILFLVFWKLMTLMAYLGMLVEKEKSEVQKGSFIYLTANYLAVLFLYIFFFYLHRQSGSWLLSNFHISMAGGVLPNILIVFGFLGFGIKAGFMPFHFWLPRAHPIAPTALSAFLSGVIVKTGIYGIFRMCEFLNPAPVWMGWFVLTIGIFSAIFGVWYALAQHDIKKLLAYHTVENIGIIGLGIGMGLLGKSYSNTALIYLGFGGALLHTLNHAVFKSLLFIGSGVIYQNVKTRDIEKMGGIAHAAPFFMILFVIGSVAISGIPPLNGFISELIIFKSFFETASELKGYYPLFMLLMAVGLAFVGGLAVACFTKINSIMFLGSPRMPMKSFHVHWEDYFSMSFLAAICLGIGFFPQPLISLVNRVALSVTPDLKGTTTSVFDLTSMAIFFALLLIVTGTFFGLKFIWVKKNGFRDNAAWGCGYTRVSPRMQYTASSYADAINSIAVSVLGIHKRVEIPKGVFPESSHLSTHSEDYSEKKLVMPLYEWILVKVNRVEFLSRTDMRNYITFILISLVIFSGIAWLWTL